jgi:predicted nucleic acid-binding protein
VDKLFVDTDIVLDLLLDRKPFSFSATLLFDLSERRQIQIYISPSTFSNTYYFIRKKYSHSESVKMLKGIDKISYTIFTDEKIIRLALDSDFSDFEDAIQYYCASKISGIIAIITRNIRDYKLSEIPIMTAEAYIKSKIPKH